MKPQKTKNKALELYITNLSVEKICKQLKIGKPTFYKWHKSGGWAKLREDAKHKLDRNITDNLINKQLLLTGLAVEELMKRLKKDNPDLKDNDLISLLKHEIELVRPKQVTNNLNITKNETAIQIVIPKEVEELLQKEVIIE